MRRVALSLLAIIASLQMVGDLSGSLALKALGAATGASPAPKVFCSVGGYEAFSARFELGWKDDAGRAHGVIVSPEIYARMKGPYNRRNVYGAVLAGGPLLERHPLGVKLKDAVIEQALGEDAPLLRELGLIAEGEGVHDVFVRYHPRPGSVPEGHTLEVRKR
jgi:hypothetical protein